MDLIGVLRACVLRWWVVLPVLALTAWFCRDQYLTATPQFTASGVVVIAPSTALLDARGNQSETGVLVTSPFNGGDGPRLVAGLTARALNTATVRSALLPGGRVALQATRDVQADPSVVDVVVVSDEAATARDGIEAVLAGANAVAEDVQRTALVPDGQFLNAYRGGPVDPPLVAYPDRVRGVVGFALAGVLLAVVLAVLAQSLLEGRARRRASSARQAGDPPAHQAVPPAADPGAAAPAVPARSEVPGRRSRAAADRSGSARPGRSRAQRRAALRETAPVPVSEEEVDVREDRAAPGDDLARTGTAHHR